jgi:hypothetical protein
LKKILPIFSYIFHPILIPTIGCLLFFIMSNGYYFASNFEIALILFQVVVITIFIPIAFYFLLKSFGMVDSVMVVKLSQRKIPLIIQAILILILIKAGAIEDRIFELYFYFLGGFLSTIFILVFLFFRIKISIHMVGIASLLFFIIGLSIHNFMNCINLISFLLVITGFVASSRLAMKAHNYKELSFGFISGMFSQLIFWRFWL